MKLEPIAWALYWGPDDLCDIVTAKRLADAWLARNSNATACKPFVAPLYPPIPEGYKLVPVELLKRIEFAAAGYCPNCSGWMVTPNGCNPKVHTKECELAAAIAMIEGKQ